MDFDVRGEQEISSIVFADHENYACKIEKTTLGFILCDSDGCADGSVRKDDFDYFLKALDKARELGWIS